MPNFQISDLPLATLPLDSANSFFEVQTVEGGVPVSRRIAETNIMADLPDGTTVGSIIRLSVVPDLYVNSEQILADGTSVELQHVTTPVVRTLTTAAGGLQVDNQFTGGGFERVLTQSDLLIAFDDLTDVTLTAPATGAVLYKSAGNWLDTPGILIDPAADVKLHQATVEVARTLTAAAGGLEVNNTLTGGGFERALTASDLFTGGLDDLSDVTLTAPATGSVLYKSAGNWLDTNAIQIDPAARVQLLDNGNLRFRTDVNDGVAVFATTDIRPKIIFRDTADTADQGTMGFHNTTSMSMRNSVSGGQIHLQMNDGVTRNAFQATPGADARLYFDNASVARTAAAASGGLEANNTLTGAGFERVLTTADIFGGALNDLSDVVITAAASFDTLFFNGSNWVDSAQLQVTGDGATLGGVTIGITGIGVRGRFNSVGESGGSTQSRVAFSDDDAGTAYGEIEWNTTGGGVDGDAMYFRNRRHGGNIEFEGENDIGTLVPMLGFDPQTVIQTIHTDVVLDGATTRFISIVPTGGATFRITDVEGTPDVITLGMLGQNAQLTMTDTEIVTLGNIGTGSGATFVGGGINDRIDFLAATTNNLRFQWTTGRWDIHSLTNGDDIALQADQGGGATSTVLLGDPNGSTDLFFANVSKLSTENLGVTMTGASGGFLLDANGVAFATPSDIRARNSEGGFRLRADGDNFALFQTDLNGTNEDTWMTATNNAGIGLYHNNAETARTLTVATGGLEADNQLTGAGFRRVLTEADALTDTLLADTSIPLASFVTILTVRAEANFNYAITGMILLDVPDAGDDSSWRFTLPAGATGEVQWMGFDQTGAAHFRTTEGGLFTSNDAGGVSLTSYAFTGMLRIAGTAGDVDIDIAKILNVGGDALAKDGSWMKLVPVLEAP